MDSFPAVGEILMTCVELMDGYNLHVDVSMYPNAKNMMEWIKEQFYS